MNEDLRKEIQLIVQEELDGNSSSRSNPSRNIITQTRALIQASTSNAARSSPNHQDRILSGKGKKRKAQDDKESIFEIVVLKKNEDAFKDEDTLKEEYIFCEQMVVLSGMINLKSSMTELEIRKIIEKSLKGKLPLLNFNDFKFVKRDRNKIITPCVEKDFKWNFAQIKRLVGQGKLYVRLTSNIRLWNDEHSDSSDDLPPVFNRDPTIHPMSDTPCSSRQAFIENLFPSLTPEQISSCLTYETLEEAADAAARLVEVADSETIDDGNKKIETLFQLFELLKLQLNPEKKLLVVTEEYILEDAFIYYKAKDFNPCFPLKIRFSNQPGIDAGGLLRQFYTLLYCEFSNSCSQSIRLFEGRKNHIVPVCRPDTILNEIFVIIGKIFSHGICQGIPPLKIAKSALNYVLYDSIPEAAVHCTLEDVSSEVAKHFIGEVRYILLNKVVNEIQNIYF